ncbi:hypothetical protein QN362_02335 [Actimicrobium sp. CCC2.4]|uniref:hypothetical protein n=1 Tax=Actimicrobium sp. CCC2.4 TaxID=3048606 RepID=UPI002B24E960|nr:hypothetical protein [Actimicrobium sp. CCC2.4]MEB0134162.1 hypothetical protein [Actimicrobium sp. CCC2.4]
MGVVAIRKGTGHLNRWLPARFSGKETGCLRPTLVLAQRRRSTRQVTGDESSDVLPGALGKNAIPQECQGTAGIFF